MVAAVSFSTRGLSDVPPSYSFPKRQCTNLYLDNDDSASDNLPHACKTPDS